jgi:hypothetical protein
MGELPAIARLVRTEPFGEENYIRGRLGGISSRMRLTDHLDPSFRHQRPLLWLSLRSPRRDAEPTGRCSGTPRQSIIRELAPPAAPPQVHGNANLLLFGRWETHHNPNSGSSNVVAEEKRSLEGDSEACRVRAGWRKPAPATVSLARGIPVYMR